VAASGKIVEINNFNEGDNHKPSQNANQREWPALERDRNIMENFTRGSRGGRGGMMQKNHTRHFYNSKQAANNLNYQENRTKRGRPPSFDSPTRENPPPPGLLHSSPTEMDQLDQFSSDPHGPGETTVETAETTPHPSASNIEETEPRGNYTHQTVSSSPKSCTGRTKLEVVGDKDKATHT